MREFVKFIANLEEIFVVLAQTEVHFTPLRAFSDLFLLINQITASITRFKGHLKRVTNATVTC